MDRRHAIFFNSSFKSCYQSLLTVRLFDYSIIWNVTPIASTTTREVLRARASTCVQGQERRHRQGGPGVLRQAAALHQVKNARLTQLCICVHHDISCIEAGKYNIYVK